MGTISINARVDEQAKKQCEQIFEELGLTMSAAINIFLKKTVSYGGIPFEMRVAQPNTATLAAMEEVEQMKQHPELYQKYANFNELVQEVTAEVEHEV